LDCRVGAQRPVRRIRMVIGALKTVFAASPLAQLERTMSFTIKVLLTRNMAIEQVST
jgi:hypothetical protein